MTDSTTPLAPAPTPTETSEPREAQPRTPRRSRTRTLLLTGAAIVAAAALTGGGVAVGAALSDDDDEITLTSAGDDGNDRAEDDGGSGAPAAYFGAASADELSDIIQTAAAAAEGSAVAIDAERDGSWEVKFRAAGGSEAEVRVAADGTATVVSTEAADSDDPAPQNVLDAATVSRLVDRAMAEQDGRVVDLELDDDPASPFDITVLTAEGRQVDITLDADLSVVAADRD